MEKSIGEMIEVIRETLVFDEDDYYDLTPVQLTAIYTIAIEVEEKFKKIFEKTIDN